MRGERMRPHHEKTCTRLPELYQEVAIVASHDYAPLPDLARGMIRTGIVARVYEGSGCPVSAHARRLNSATSAIRSEGVPVTNASPASGLVSETTRACKPLFRGCPIVE